jgi:hypothetical protein
MDETKTTASTAPVPVLGYDGTFTIRSPAGEHRTFRIRTITKKDRNDSALAGRRALEVLIGSNNSTDYLRFGFVGESSDDPARPSRVVVSSSFLAGEPKRRGIARKIEIGRLAPRAEGETDHERFAAMLADFATGPRSRLVELGYQIDESRVCRRCGRALTTPESIDSGIGPVCDGKDGE